MSHTGQQPLAFPCHSHFSNLGPDSRWKSKERMLRRDGNGRAGRRSGHLKSRREAVWLGSARFCRGCSSLAVQHFET
jgi:hypothetical protein